MKPRKHHDTIVSWANGADIQYRKPVTGKWEDTSNPAFVDDYEYRVKPAREYPESAMTDSDLINEFNKWQHKGAAFHMALRRTTDAALRHACDNGQVVTREEFDRAVGDRAARDLAVSIAVRDALIMVAAVAPNVPTFRNMAQKADLFAIIDKVQA